MTKVRVAELSDDQLHECIAKARGWELKRASWRHGVLAGLMCWFSGDEPLFREKGYTPTTNREQWSELVESQGITLTPVSTINGKIDAWSASKQWPVGKHPGQVGMTPGHAVCRAFVAESVGMEVEV